MKIQMALCNGRLPHRQPPNHHMARTGGGPLPGDTHRVGLPKSNSSLRHASSGITSSWGKHWYSSRSGLHHTTLQAVGASIGGQYTRGAACSEGCAARRASISPARPSIFSEARSSARVGPAVMIASCAPFSTAALTSRKADHTARELPTTSTLPQDCASSSACCARAGGMPAAGGSTQQTQNKDSLQRQPRPLP